MAWIESHQHLGRHPKTKAAARALDISRVQMVGHLHYLWWWALDFAEDGDLSGFTADDVAEEAMWEGDPATFLVALRESGFLTDDLRINDWEQYTGRLVAQRVSNRQRQRRHRERQEAPEPTAPRDPDVTSQTTAEQTERDVTVTKPLRHGATLTVPYQTNQTGPDHEGEDGAGAPPDDAEPPPPKVAAPKRPTRIPEAFAVTVEMRQWAADQGITARQIDYELAKFRDYWRASPKAHLDWVAVWRNWMRRSQERSPNGAGMASARGSPNGSNFAEARRLLAGEPTQRVPDDAIETHGRIDR